MSHSWLFRITQLDGYKFPKSRSEDDLRENIAGIIDRFNNAKNSEKFGGRLSDIRMKLERLHIKLTEARKALDSFNQVEMSFLSRFDAGPAAAKETEIRKLFSKKAMPGFHGSRYGDHEGSHLEMSGFDDLNQMISLLEILIAEFKSADRGGRQKYAANVFRTPSEWQLVHDVCRLFEFVGAKPTSTARSPENSNAKADFMGTLETIYACVDHKEIKPGTLPNYAKEVIRVRNEYVDAFIELKCVYDSNMDQNLDNGLDPETREQISLDITPILLRALIGAKFDFSDPKWTSAKPVAAKVQRLEKKAFKHTFPYFVDLG